MKFNKSNIVFSSIMLFLKRFPCHQKEDFNTILVAFYSQPITRERYNGTRPGVRYNSTDAPSE